MPSEKKRRTPAVCAAEEHVSELNS